MQTIYSSLYQTIADSRLAGGLLRKAHLSIVLALGVGVALTGCSNESMQGEAVTGDATGADLVRVVVTLKTSAEVEEPSDAKTDLDTAVRYLTQRYPDAKVLRSMPSFSQVVIELPSAQLAALRTEQMVKSAHSDEIKHSMQNKP